MDVLRKVEELAQMTKNLMAPTEEMAAHLEACVQACKSAWSLLAESIESGGNRKTNTTTYFKERGVRLAQPDPNCEIWLLSDGRLAETKTLSTHDGWSISLVIVTALEVADKYDVAQCVDALYRTIEGKAKHNQEKWERLQKSIIPATSST